MKHLFTLNSVIADNMYKNILEHVMDVWKHS
jgi:hypothetical protein